MSIQADQGQVKRLIVLVPDSLENNMDLAHKIHWLALRERCEVFYLALVDDEEQLLAMSRSIATMKAVTAGNWLIVNSKVTETKHWLSALRDIFAPGDIIVCHAEQSVQAGLFRTEPISDFLHRALHARTIVIDGFYHPAQVQVRRWFHELWYWAGFLFIIALFFAIEITLDQAIQGAGRILLLMLVLCIEFGAVLAWNNYSRR